MDPWARQNGYTPVSPFYMPGVARHRAARRLYSGGDFAGWCHRGAAVLCIGFGLVIGLALGLLAGLYATSNYSHRGPLVASDLHRMPSSSTDRFAGITAHGLTARGGGLLSAARTPRSLTQTVQDPHGKMARIRVGNAANVELPGFGGNKPSPRSIGDDQAWMFEKAKAEPRLAEPALNDLDQSKVIHESPPKPEATTELPMRKQLTESSDQPRKNLSTCPGMTNLQIDHVAQRKFNVVLLATFPRSGSSWTRTLLRGSTQIKTDLTTVKGLSRLEEAATLSRNPEASEADLKRSYRQLGVSWLTSVKKARPLYGIGGSEEEVNRCLQTYTRHKEFANQPWPYYPEAVPVVIKTHYPQIGDADTEAFTKKVNKIIHIVRNPMDAIASRYLGNQRQHQERFDALKQARANGTTTPEFNEFYTREAERLKTFYQYWIQRRSVNADLGIQTLFVRYEVLCDRTSAVLDNIVDFIGYRSVSESLDCTLENMGCHSQGDFPTHRALYTNDQLSYLVSEQEQLLQDLGYKWNSDKNIIEAVSVDIMCDYW